MASLSLAQSDCDPWCVKSARYWRQSAAAESVPSPDCCSFEWRGDGWAVGCFDAVPSSPFDPEWPDAVVAPTALELRPGCPRCPPTAENPPASATPPTTATAATPTAAPASAFACQRPRRGGRRWE